MGSMCMYRGIAVTSDLETTDGDPAVRLERERREELELMERNKQRQEQEKEERSECV